MTTWTVAAALSAALVGCGGASIGTAKTPDGKPVKDSSGQSVSEAAANRFKAGLDAMTQHDKAGDWTPETCSATAQLFAEAAKEQGAQTFAEAEYNAGLALQRCRKHDEAKAKFQEVLQKNPKFHQARVQLAMYAFSDSGEKAFDPAIAELTQSVRDAEFKNVEALVNLAMVQMRRGNTEANDDGKDDFERAKKNLQRALAVDDSFMPAFNQLGVYYLESAKRKAGRTNRRVSISGGRQAKVDTQALELAALVCSQAIRKNPGYAPIHNTAGLIQVELGNLNSAVSAFNTARKLDPSFFEAQMNFAAVNLQFRGFAQAEDAYRGALKMQPNDFEAHLGLALALRGQIDDSNFDKMVAAASAELGAARKIAPDRPETYYNEGILTQEYKAKAGGPASEKELLSAKDLFGQFVAKAGAAPEYAEAVKQSKNRMQEIDQIISFNKQTEAERKAAEAEMRQREAEAEAKGETVDPNAPPPPPPDGQAPPPPAEQPKPPQ
jgi:tetratricopeptide (TPR) repeat protein